MAKNNGSGGARRVKKSNQQGPDAAPAPRPEAIRDEQGKFMPGTSGNPAGRPIGHGGGPSLLVALKKRLEAHPEEINAIVGELIGAARAGDLKAIEIVADRLDGKPTQRSEISGPDGGPVINIVHQDFKPELAATNGKRQAILDGLNGK